MILQICIYLVLSCAETFILHRLLTAFLVPHHSRFRLYWQGLAAYFVFQMFSYVLAAPLFSTAALYFLFTMVIATAFFTDNLQTKASLASLFVVLNYACKVLAVTVIMQVGHQAMPSLPQDLVLGWSAQISACVLFWSCVLIIIGCRNLRVSNHQLAYTLITYIVPIGILVIVTRMFYHSHNRTASLIYLDAAGLLFCCSLALFYLLDKSAVIDQKNERELMSRQLITTQERSYQQLEQFQKEMQSIRHDIKNHIKCAIALMEQGESAQAQDYLTKLYAATAQLESPVQCGNRVADILLNHALSDMRRADIRCEHNVLLPPELPPIDNLDLCTLLGNLLDNAIEACHRMVNPDAERYISVNISVRKGYLFLAISNSYNGELRPKDNSFQSVKSGPRPSGIGISNVRRVVERYHGEMNFKHSGTVFTVTAMLAIDC